MILKPLSARRVRRLQMIIETALLARELTLQQSQGPDPRPPAPKPMKSEGRALQIIRRTA